MFDGFKQAIDPEGNIFAAFAAFPLNLIPNLQF
jgi:hypothetical protein